ncbi:MAG: hypothetical protein DI551_09075 [Micavibrio aeruginosavorus]|uniref:DUF2125 domain-containing protein n=1 Tax=Micavibrio aeruginosavorus TaxID=349221 RepID=A0A2W5MX59_9BACT|nr:MAG: hypothetical protein DI551_09075 [Micavibrio aeruginosavorus]
MKKIALFAFLALFFSPMAYAAPANDERVQILKGQIEGFLENQKAMALKNGCRLDTKGLITVEQANGYYAFTLPHITYTDSKGVRSEIGMVAVNATPAEGNDWKISVALPTPISSFTSGGSEAVRTDIGTQSATGIWNEKLGHFTQLSAKLGNIRINDLIDQSTATIGSLQLTSQLAEQDAEAYTGTAVATLDNISFFNADTNFKGTLPKAVFNTNLADRAMKTPMTKDQVKNRKQAGYPDFYNVVSFLIGAPERVQANVTGLDAINAQLQQSMITATPDVRGKLLQGILGVSAVSGMGKPVAGDASTKAYDVVFGSNGNVTINGTDFGSLMNVQPAAGGASAGTPTLR